MSSHARIDTSVATVESTGEACVGCGAHSDEARCPHCGTAHRVLGYRVLKVLHQNAHGRLYLARDANGQSVALKELLFATVPDVSSIEAFEREAKVLRQLKHERVPRFIESFQVGQGVHTRLYLAQEFVEGQNLLEKLQTHRFSEAEARDLARQVLEVLVHLHGLSPALLNRDLKPANLVERSDGSVALVDFGSSRDLTGAQTHGSTLVGTFGYMPPEQLGGTVRPSSDLYALGASLLHLLSGREPAASRPRCSPRRWTSISRARSTSRPTSARS